MEEKKEESKSLSSYLAKVLSGQTNEAKSNWWDNILAALAYTKTGQYFLNQTIYIDDYTFERCRFDNCTLVTYKGTFRFVHCIVANTAIQYGAEAFKVAKLFNSMTTYSDLYPSFKVTINADGTFTLE